MNFNQINEFQLYIAIGLLGALFLVQLYFRFVSEKQLRKIITVYYKTNGFKVIEISNLTIKEKIKYGVPLNSLLEMYRFMFTIFFKFGDNHYKKVETGDNNGNEQIRYIDLYIKKRRLKSCKEFDVYNF